VIVERGRSLATVFAADTDRKRSGWAWLVEGKWKYIGTGALLMLLAMSGVWVTRSVGPSASPRASVGPKPPDAASGPVAPPSLDPLSPRPDPIPATASLPSAKSPPAVPPRKSAEPPRADPAKLTTLSPARPPSDQTHGAPASPVTSSRPSDAFAPPRPVDKPVAPDKPVTPDPSERPPTPGPSQIRTEVEQKLRSAGLLKDAGVEGLGVTVDINSDRVVTITGVLRDEEQRREAVRLAREVQGVSDVKQKINLRKSWSSG